MSDVQRASAEAVEAAKQSEQFALILAAVTAAQQAQQPACSCQHGHQAPAGRRSAGQVVAYASAAACLGCIVVAMFLATAMVACAVGISALVSFFLVREIRRPR